MELLELLASLVVGVLAMIVVATALVVERAQISRMRGQLRQRIRRALPFFGILGIVLVFNTHTRLQAHELSWVVGLRITPWIVRLEGVAPIVFVQSVFGEEFSTFFTLIYVYGYVFLLVFPLVAYFLLDRLDVFKSVTAAYAANYAIGLVCYVLFVAYGPRNRFPTEVVEYFHPDFQLLTSEINQNTNVFPSLHTSLSATVMLFAWRTREEYPRWLAVALFFGTSVIVSTMYLAIHWLIDVLAGIGLAGVSYWIGVRAVERDWLGQLALRRRIAALRSAFG